MSTTEKDVPGAQTVPPSPRKRSADKYAVDGFWTVRCHNKNRLRFKSAAVASAREAVDLYARYLNLKVETVEIPGKKDTPPKRVVSVRGKLSNGTEFNVPAVVTAPDGKRSVIEA